MRRTLALLPSSVPVLRLTTPIFWSRSALCPALPLPSLWFRSYGEVRAIDPGRPGVPPFGRRLYNLNAYSFARRKDAEGHRTSCRSSQDLGQSESSPTEHAIQGLCKMHSARRCNIFAKDCFERSCSTTTAPSATERHRLVLRQSTLSSRLVRLLDGGLMIGIATGRGQSVRSALTAHIPRRHWKQVTVGYYNCGEVGSLADDGCPKPSSTAGPALAGAATALAEDSDRPRAM